MHSPLFLSVTRDDIAAGARSDPVGCPVALSLTRVLGRMAFVTRDEICSVDGGFRYKVPPALRDWIEAFDGGRRVHPIRIKLLLTPDFGG